MKRLAAVLLALLLAAPAQAGGVWRRGESADPGSLDPHKVTTAVEGHILDELYEGLTVYDGHAVLRPGVAARWDISPDKTVYTFHLRPDARWSNGAALTAEDFVYSFRRLMDPKTGAPYASILYTVKNARSVNSGGMPVEALGIRALDPATLEITLEHPTAYFLEQLTHFTAMPVYRASIERWGDGFARPGRMVGNGAFLLESHMPNDRLVLTKNPLFHDAAAVRLDREIFYPIEDRSAALRRFMAGEIDTYDEVPVDQIAFVRAHLADDFKVAPSLGTYYYVFDTRQKPFDDVRVRQALTMVVDRDFLAHTIWGDTMLASYSFVPPGMQGYGTPESETWAKESLFQREDEAKALMAAAGYGPDHPLHLTLHFNTSENHRRTAIAIADMWRVLGITTSFVVSDAASYYSTLQSGKSYDVARSSWYADFPDAQNYLFLAESDSNAMNYSHFANAEYDGLMARAATEADAERRIAILHQAERLLLAQAPVLPLLRQKAPNLVSPHLHGWTKNIMDHHPGREMWKDEHPAG